MHDPFYYLLLFSDPIISSFSKKPYIRSRSTEALDEEVLALLTDASMQRWHLHSDSESDIN